MAINLNKNRELLLAAWKDVLDDKTPTNWAVFGYEGLTNDLKVVSKGANGIEEMVEDLNSGKIMYAFLKVKDPKTSLPKNVLINWQGEGAPNVRKGTCANHIRDVGNFFKGAHVTLNARTEEEVDSTLIIDKVAKSTGSVYKFTERAEHSNDSGPVGTAYKRTIPKQEINAVERDKFWEQQEVEERQRQETERRKRVEEAKRLEEERRKRDSEETALRENKIRETTKSIEQIRLAEKASLERTQAAVNQPVEDLEKEERERRNRADVLRRQRSEEAQALISKRTIDARAIFERNTAAGQLTHRRSSVQPKGTSEITPAQRRSSEAQLPIPKVEPLPILSEPVVPRQEVKPAAQEVTPTPTPVGNGINGGTAHQILEEEPQGWEDDIKHEIPVTHAPTSQEAAIEEHLLLPPEQFINGDFGLTARAVYDYQAADETEITFDPGDVITHIDQIDEGWWQGLAPDGTYGLFPANYVELIK